MNTHEQLLEAVIQLNLNTSPVIAELDAMIRNMPKWNSPWPWITNKYSDAMLYPPVFNSE